MYRCPVDTLVYRISPIPNYGVLIFIIDSLEQGEYY